MVKTISVSDDSHSIWRSECGRYTVLISLSCLDKITQLAKNRYPNEVGTPLVGWYSEDGFNAYVLDVGPSSSDSKGALRSFCRGRKGLRRFFAELWGLYHGNRFYVGEWHSHPGAAPIPSTLDDITQSAISANLRTNCPESILVIIGGNPFIAPDLGVFVYSRKQGRVHLVEDETEREHRKVSSYSNIQ